MRLTTQETSPHFMSSIYLDYAAATPCDPRVFAAMEPFFSVQFYNPSSAYAAARAVRAVFEQSRAQLANVIGVKGHEVVLTAGATESVNLALRGVLAAFPASKMAVCATEHQAVIELAKRLPAHFIDVDRYGVVREEALRAAIDDEVSIVSIGLVNSETGTKQPLRKLTTAVREIRADRRRRGVTLPLYVHTDASQAAGISDLSAHRLGVDLMTLSASKIYGPKQAGLLYIGRDVRLEPLIVGGGQEMELRSGTENVAAVAGFAEALRLAVSERESRLKAIKDLRAVLRERLAEKLPDATFTVPNALSAPHILHFSLPGIDGERLLFMLDEAGVMLATGAACAANKQTRSHVLAAMGLSEQTIQGSVRISLSHLLSVEVAGRAADVIVRCAQHARQGVS